MNKKEEILRKHLESKKGLANSLNEEFDLIRDATLDAMEEYKNQSVNVEEVIESELQRLYEWLMDENREPAQTYFTSGMLRNVAKEIELIKTGG